MTARQGHRYRLDGTHDCIALESGETVKVALLDPASPYPLIYPYQHVSSERLQPQPMAYFHGETPT